MAKGRTICNVCGKEFSDYDEQERIGLHSKSDMVVSMMETLLTWISVVIALMC